MDINYLGSDILKPLSDSEFQKFREYIKQKLGINLSEEKRSLVFSRLRPIVAAKNIDNFTDYFKFVISDQSGKALTEMINRITTNHTYFMRETDHFDHLRDKALPEIFETFSSQKDMRLWCAASSSGEEPYTLQMIIEDFFKDRTPKWNTTSLATDISASVLNKAIHGVYSNEGVDELPAAWQKAYFKKFDDDNSIIVDNIKSKIMFRKLNLMDEPFPFKKKFHIIFCRNVMIYFDEATKNNLIRRMYDILEQGGYLYIGHSETIGRANEGFKYIMPAVYKKV